MADLSFVATFLYEVVVASLPKHGQCGEAIHNCGVPLCCHGNVVVGCIYICSRGVLYTFVLYSVTSVSFRSIPYRNQLDIIYNTRSLLKVWQNSKNHCSYTQKSKQYKLHTQGEE